MGPLGNLHDEGQVGVPAVSQLLCLAGRWWVCGVRKGIPSQAQIYCSFSSAHSPFWCFSALHGALDHSVCQRVPVVPAVPAVPAVLPMGWMAPVPQPGFLRVLGTTPVITCRLYLGLTSGSRKSEAKQKPQSVRLYKRGWRQLRHSL